MHRLSVLLGVLAAFAALATGAAASHQGGAPPLEPIDPQDYALPEHQTWADYESVPGTDWSNPALVPSVRTWRTALIAVDFPNQEFVVTQPPFSTVFGNPQSTAHSIPRDDVPEFYRDFLNKPQPLNNFVTMNKYWMENSLGRYGVQVDAFGPYRMPGNAFEYHLRDAGNAGAVCPTGYDCRRVINGSRNNPGDARRAWIAEVGQAVADSYDNIFIFVAGQDKSGTWQEFGEMKFQTMNDVTEPFGNPDETKPNWAPTRYVPWTSFASATSIWPSASGNSSTEAESSGMGVFAHELSHNLGIGDNYNNPYGIPLRRSYTGPWDMLSRGSFNGPGGPHTRWFIPATQGAALGSNHNLRNRVELGTIKEENILRVDASQLALSGPVVATITARAADPGPAGLTGVNVVMPNGDQTPPCDLLVTPDCPATASEQAAQRFNNYTLEVVQRIGNDSFTPGHGVLISRTKNGPVDRAPFVWIIDAHPEDIDKEDFRRPNGEVAKYSYGDYRQLSDATFNAGLGSGTKYEYVDEANRLHFYVIDVDEDRNGILSYTVGIRSLDEDASPQRRGVFVWPGKAQRVKRGWAANCNFKLTNSGRNAASTATHPEDVSAYLDGDVYRLSVSVLGKGWNAELYNELATAEFGRSTAVPVYVTRERRSGGKALVFLRAVSETDPSKKSVSVCSVSTGDLNRSSRKRDRDRDRGRD